MTPAELSDFAALAGGQAANLIPPLRRYCTCESRVIETRIAPIRQAIRDAIARQDYAAAKLLASTPTIPRVICTCRGRAERRAAKRARLLTPRPIRRRVPGREINACYTGWPGGFDHFDPGQPLPAGWVHTGFAGGFPTNPRCYPPRAAALLDVGNDGTFSGARREATLAHTNPDLVAQNLQGVTAALVRGTITPAAYSKIISGLVAPPIAASQAAQRKEPKTPEQLAAERKQRQSGAFDEAAFALRYAEDVCRPTFCAWDGPSWGESQNKGVTKDVKVLRDRLARGWHARVLDIPEVTRRLGHKPTEAEEIGACADRDLDVVPGRLRGPNGHYVSIPAPRAPVEIITQPAGGSHPLTPGPAAPALGAAPPPPGAPGGKYFCCQRVPFGYPIGEPACGYASDPMIAGLFGKWPWS